MGNKQDTYRCAFVSSEKGQCTKEFGHAEPEHTYEPDMPWTATLERLQEIREQRETQRQRGEQP